MNSTWLSLTPLLFLLSVRAVAAQSEPFAVRITFGYTDQEAVSWSGSIRADQATVTSMEGWLFLESDSLSLNTFDLTAGGPIHKGITLQGTTSDRGRFFVTSNRGTFSFSPAELTLGRPATFLDGAARAARLPDAFKMTDDFRDDDFPSIAVAADSSAWAVWQSYSGLSDEVHLSKYDGMWHPLTRLPGVSGDVWKPQVALDARGRPLIVWSQQVNGNFDLYARILDPETNAWLEPTRLTTHPNPDIDHHLVSDAEGNCWVVWQGFQGDNSDIFLRRLDSSGWSGKIRITEHPANDWEPRIAVGAEGRAHIAWDTYRNGNYDVYMRTYQDGRLGPLTAVASTPRFEAHASVALDGRGRIWVAWDEAGPNWGKDYGPTVDPNWRESTFAERWVHSPGIPVYDFRTINMVVVEGNLRRVPAGAFPALDPAVGDSYDYPQLLIDRPSGRVGLLFHRRGHTGPARNGQVYWESAVTFYEGGAWSPIQALPNSWGRSSSRPAAAYGPEGELWLAWPTDGRLYRHSHRPLVGNVYTARLSLATPPPAPLLELQGEAPSAEIKAGHANEPADVQAIRSYRTFVRGVEKRIVRGDFHRHTELSWDAGGRYDGSLIDFYRYMLDAAAMDFGAVTDHFAGGGHEYWWWLTEKSCDLYHLPRRFTTFYGYERSVVFPNGHRNVFHTRRGVPMVRYFSETGYRGESPFQANRDVVGNDTKLLYESLHQSGGISIPHTSTSSRMGTDWRDNDPAVEPVVEIFQGDRVSSEHLGAPRAARSAEDNPPGGFQEAGFLWNAYRKGYRLGTITSSDHVSTHISYAMVYTTQPDREAIFEGFRNRHTYGATDNIILDYRMGDHFMGEEFTALSVPPLQIRVIGTSQVASVEIIKNEEVIFTTRPDRREVDLTYVDQDPTPGSSYYYVRVIQDDRQIAWSSPIWVNTRP